VLGPALVQSGLTNRRLCYDEKLDSKKIQHAAGVRLAKGHPEARWRFVLTLQSDNTCIPGISRRRQLIPSKPGRLRSQPR
jgi:hypothetical protein